MSKEIRIGREVYSEFRESMNLVNDSILNDLCEAVEEQIWGNCCRVVETGLANQIEVCTNNVLAAAETKLYL
jgi:hypothetical protein